MTSVIIGQSLLLLAYSHVSADLAYDTCDIAVILMHETSCELLKG